MKLIVMCLSLFCGVAFSQGNGVRGVVTATGASVSSGLDIDGWYSFRVCEGDAVTFECSSGVLAVESGTCDYGSTSQDPGYAACPHSANGECGNSASCNTLLEDSCEGQSSCTVSITNGGVGSDPCGGVYKYAAMRLQCVRPVRETRAEVTATGAAVASGLDDDGWYNFRVCEGVAATFRCSTGVLVVNPNQQCVYGSEIEDPGYAACPHSSKGDCDTTASCDNLLAEQCQGESECTFSPNNGVNGDPCPGIYKYAAVSLRCERAAAAAHANFFKGDAYASALSTVKIPSMYLLFAVILAVILALNIVYMAVRCCGGQRATVSFGGRSKRKYKQVNVESEVDDSEAHLNVVSE